MKINVSSSGGQEVSPISGWQYPKTLSSSWMTPSCVLSGTSVKKATLGLFYDISTNPIQKSGTLMTS